MKIICDVCGKKGTDCSNGVICKFCDKFMLFSCGCYGSLSKERKCCGRED